MIQDERVSDDGIRSPFGTRTLRLTHAVPNHLTSAKLHLLSVAREVILHLDDEIGIRKADPVSHCRAKHLGVSGSAHDMGHSQGPPQCGQDQEAANGGNAPMTACWKP